MKLNPKTKTAAALLDTSARLQPSDLPQQASLAYRAALSAFEDALHHLFPSYDVKSFGYEPDDGTWHAIINAPRILNHCTLAGGLPIAPYYITGEVSAFGATPAACVESLSTKYAAATEWQHMVVQILKARAASAETVTSPLECRALAGFVWH